MSLLKRLFGGSGGGGRAAEIEPVEYKGFRIIPEPVPEDGQFRLAARIEKEVEGALRTHHLIRADVIRDRDQAVEAAVNKARQMIDQMGERLFN